jgi:hypothetical protein
MADVLLGAIDLQYSGGGVVAADGPTNLPFDASVEKGGLYVDQPKGGNFVISPPPGGGGMVTLPSETVTYFPGGPSGGGGAAPDLQADYPVVGGEGSLPPEKRPAGGTSVSLGPQREGFKPMNKKNMLLFGIGALVLGYLLLRKK